MKLHIFAKFSRENLRMDPVLHFEKGLLGLWKQVATPSIVTMDPPLSFLRRYSCGLSLIPPTLNVHGGRMNMNPINISPPLQELLGSTLHSPPHKCPLAWRCHSIPTTYPITSELSRSAKANLDPARHLNNFNGIFRFESISGDSTWSQKRKAMHVFVGI